MTASHGFLPGSGTGSGFCRTPAMPGLTSMLLLFFLMMTRLTSGKATTATTGIALPTMLSGYAKPLSKSANNDINIESFKDLDLILPPILADNRTGTAADLPFTLPNRSNLLPNPNEATVDGKSLDSHVGSGYVQAERNGSYTFTVQLTTPMLDRLRHFFTEHAKEWSTSTNATSGEVVETKNDLTANAGYHFETNTTTALALITGSAALCSAACCMMPGQTSSGGGRNDRQPPGWGPDMRKYSFREWCRDILIWS